MTLSKTYTFVVDTDIEPSEVNQNFDEIVEYINDEMPLLSGASFTGAVGLPATDPVSDNHAARKAYVDSKTRISGGSATGTTDSNGQIGFNHSLGYEPAMFLANLNLGANVAQSAYYVMPFDITPTQLHVRVYARSTGLAVAAQNFTVYWMSFGVAA
jgi:hypothetical protein